MRCTAFSGAGETYMGEFIWFWRFFLRLHKYWLSPVIISSESAAGDSGQRGFLNLGRLGVLVSAAVVVPEFPAPANRTTGVTMTIHESLSNLENKNLVEFLQRLDQRISRIETHLGLARTEASSLPVQPTAAAPPAPAKVAGFGDSAGLERNIGEFGLAWVGSAILLLGIAFLMTYTYGLGYRGLATALGYLSAAGCYFASRLWKNSATHLSRIMASGSVILLYYATLRLHYFSNDPLVRNAVLAFSALLLVVAHQFFIAIRRNSQVLAVLAVLLALISGHVSDSARIGLSLLVVVCAVVVRLAMTRRWWPLLLFTVLLTYASHLLWLLNNPLMGNPLGAISADRYSLVYLFLCALIFFWSAFDTDRPTEPGTLTVVFLNSAGLSTLLTLAVFALYEKSYAQACLTVAAFFLACSILQWLKSHQPLVPAIYACFGYLGLSVAMYGYSGIPAVFLWLSLQSLLVVSMALWFRSKVLVVVNALIFLCILATYVTGFPSSDWVNFSFALVGHASARIMNWQKKRLTLQTEMLRNVYLVIGFVFVLYTLYHVVPANYVTLSWMAVAITYFLVSLLLKNIKYRWLAIASALVTISFLFLVDLARLDPKYRVPAFLFVGIMTLVISLYYTKFRQLMTKGRKGD